MAPKMQFESRARIKNRINLVPLINIVFLLLIFFMLSSTLITPDKFDITLPESKKGDSHESIPIVVLIRGDGKVAINNVTTTINELADLLLTEIEFGATPELMVRADASANTEDVISVLRQAKLANIESVAIATQGGGSP